MTRMSLADRAAYHNLVYAKWPAAALHVVQEQGRDVVYGTWLIGAQWGNLTPYYGSYPRTYLNRVQSIFPDYFAEAANDAPFRKDHILHVFSGSVPPGDYTRLDIRHDPAAGVAPDVVGSVYCAPTLFPLTDDFSGFGLVLADPIYSQKDAKKYKTQGVNRPRAISALASVTEPGGFLVWLDTQWPIHDLDQWVTVGRIWIIRSTNHRYRGMTIFQRGGG